MSEIEEILRKNAETRLLQLEERRLRLEIENLEISNRMLRKLGKRA